MIVTLSPSEGMFAANVGVARRIASLKRKLPNTSISPYLWENDINGAIAEYAFCKAMGLFWNTTVNVGGIEDAYGYHVKSTAHKNGHLLIKQDSPEGRYVLVTVNELNCTIVGWMHSSEAMIDAYYRNEDPSKLSWWIPQSALRPMSEA